MTILFHCVNGMGLGHLSRMFALAQALIRERPYPMVSFMTSAEEHSWLREAKIPYYFVPSEAKYRYTWPVKKTEVDDCARRRSAPEGFNDAMFELLVEYLKPTVVVFDTYFSRQKILTCVESGATPIAFFDRGDFSSVHGAAVEWVVSHGGYALFGINDCEAWSYNGVERVHRIGRIVRREDPYRSRRSECRNRTEPMRIVCVQGGGGFGRSNSTFYRDHASFGEVVTKALSSVRGDGAIFDCVIVLGPYGQWPAGIPQPDWADIRGFEPALVSLLSESDLMISTGGYNAISDSIAACCPGIFLPIKEPTENQDANVRWLAGLGAAVSLPHKADVLAEQVQEMLLNPDRLTTMREGLRTAAELSCGVQCGARIIRKVAQEAQRRR